MAVQPRSTSSWYRFRRLTSLFVRSESFPTAVNLFALILLLLAGQTWLNVFINKLNRNLFDAIEHKEILTFATFAARFVLMYLVLTLVDVVFQFIEQHLGLVLRKGLTTHLIADYLDKRAYLRLTDRQDVDNPDQRITEDVRNLTDNALSITLIVLRSLVNLYVFSVVLWSISPRLVWAAAGYAAFGSLMTVLIGKRLVRLNIDQLHIEADLRYELVRTREHAEAIALQQDERNQGPRLLARLADVVLNFRRIIARTAFLNLFTKSFAYLSRVIPILIVAPLVVRLESYTIGHVTQAVDAFVFVVNAFSVLVTEFPRLTLLSAAMSRLGDLINAIQAPPRRNGIEVREEPDRLAVENLTLVDPTDGHRYFAGLNLVVKPKEHLLIVGRPGSGKSELVLALAGMWPSGMGTIVRPPLDHIAFVPQQPYLTPVSLRHLLVANPACTTVSDEQLLEILNGMGLDTVLERAGGLDRERDWEAQLSLSERQVLAMAQLLITKPQYAVLCEVPAALDMPTRTEYYRRLDAAGVTVITLVARPIMQDFHKQFEILPGGSATSFGPAAA